MAPHCRPTPSMPCGQDPVENSPGNSRPSLSSALEHWPRSCRKHCPQLLPEASFSDSNLGEEGPCVFSSIRGPGWDSVAALRSLLSTSSDVTGAWYRLRLCRTRLSHRREGSGQGFRWPLLSLERRLLPAGLRLPVSVVSCRSAVCLAERLLANDLGISAVWGHKSRRPGLGPQPWFLATRQSCAHYSLLSLFYFSPESIATGFSVVG